MKAQSVSIKHAYEAAADVYREKYAEIPPRVHDVDMTFAASGVITPKVVEIGCAYGREGKYILTKTSHYIGIDIAQKYIDYAQAENVDGAFICVDMYEYEFPSAVDIVFAFASLLHSNKVNFQRMLMKIHASLRPGGVVFISLKRRATYSSAVVTDEYSSREFFYYDRGTVLELCDGLYSEVFYAEQVLKEPWFTMILKKE